MRKHRWTITRSSVVILVILLCVLIVFLLINKSKSSPIPSSISSKASFTIFYPSTKVKGLDPKASTINYSKANDGLAYTVLVDNIKVIVSEQATPAIFSQSGIYPYKLQQAHQYASFNTSAGEVDLTRPSGLNQQTVAWVNAKGTLILARALQNLSSAQWQLLFNNMTVIN